jgi:hypothetical protein
MTGFGISGNKTLVTLKLISYDYCPSLLSWYLNSSNPNSNYMSHLFKQSVTLYFVFICFV